MLHEEEPLVVLTDAESKRFVTMLEVAIQTVWSANQVTASLMLGMAKNDYVGHSFMKVSNREARCPLFSCQAL